MIISNKDNNSILVTQEQEQTTVNRIPFSIQRDSDSESGSLSSKTIENLSGTTTSPSLSNDSPVEFEQALQWEKNIRKEKLAPVSKLFHRIVLNLRALSEFHPSFQTSASEATQRRINKTLKAIEEIKADENYEEFRELLNQKETISLQRTLDWVEPYLRESLKELHLKKDLNDLYTKIKLETKPYDELNSLFSQFQKKLEETINFYESQENQAEVKSCQDSAFKASYYKEILNNFSAEIGKQEKPKTTKAALVSSLEKKTKDFLKVQEESFLVEFKDSLRNFNKEKSLKAFSNFQRKMNKLLSFYSERGMENPYKAWTDQLRKDIINMPEEDFQALKK